MVCVLHECLGDSVPPSPRRNLPTLHAFILAVEAAEIRLLRVGTLAKLLRKEGQGCDRPPHSD